MKNLWRWWAKSLGQKASDNDTEADKVAIIRTVIFTTYLITNCFIIAGVMKHWNDQQQIYIEIHENSNNQQIPHTERWNGLGMGRDTRVEGIYRTSTISSNIGEFE